MEISKATLKSLSTRRISEAATLIGARQWAGAYYIAGYAAELGLKAIISGRFRANRIPEKRLVNDLYTHDIERLVGIAGLEPDLDQRSNDPQFLQNWEIVKNWDESARYNLTPEREARNLLEALTDPLNGILPWIQTYW